MEYYHFYMVSPSIEKDGPNLEWCHQLQAHSKEDAVAKFAGRFGRNYGHTICLSQTELWRV
jgi:hypothetical protein